MKLKNMTKEDLELLSYTDLTEIILKENQKPMNTAEIFKQICELLELGEDSYLDKIGDYYTSLTTDKRFILLETSEWDLKDKHKVEVILDEEDFDDESIEDEEEDIEDDESPLDVEDESIEITDDEIDLDDEEDAMEELSIIEEEGLDED